jgi:hypothetical protein
LNFKFAYILSQNVQIVKWQSELTIYSLAVQIRDRSIFIMESSAPMLDRLASMLDGTILTLDFKRSGLYSFSS